MLIKRSFRPTDPDANKHDGLWGSKSWGAGRRGGDPTSWLTRDISVYVCLPGGITGYISSHTQRVLVEMINYRVTLATR